MRLQKQKPMQWDCMGQETTKEDKIGCSSKSTIAEKNKLSENEVQNHEFVRPIQMQGFEIADAGLTLSESRQKT
jgi:hypothetical protein